MLLTIKGKLTKRNHLIQFPNLTLTVSHLQMWLRVAKSNRKLENREAHGLYNLPRRAKTQDEDGWRIKQLVIYIEDINHCLSFSYMKLYIQWTIILLRILHVDSVFTECLPKDYMLHSQRTIKNAEHQRIDAFELQC